MNELEFGQELSLVASTMKATAFILTNSMPQFLPYFDLGSMFFINNY